MNAIAIRARCNVAESAPVFDADIVEYYEAGKRHGAKSLPALPSFLSPRRWAARDVLSRVYHTGHADGTATRFVTAR